MNTSCCLYVFFALFCIHFPIGVHQQKQTQKDGKITTKSTTKPPKVTTVPPKVTTTQEFSTAAPNFNSANTTQVNQLLSTTGTSMFVMLYQSKVLCDAINSIPNVPWFAYPIVKFATLTDTEKSLYCGTTSETFLSGVNTRATNVPSQSNPWPDSYDLREVWPECSKTLNNIVDQGMCMSSWAIAPAMMIQDRMCIAYVSNGLSVPDEVLHVSPADILECSNAATDNNDVCLGGSIDNATEWAATHRVVTGENAFVLNDTYCMPYSIDPSQDTKGSAAKCKHLCTNPNYQVSYKDDKKILGNGLGLQAVQINGENLIDQIKAEIVNWGSVCCSIKVLSDFFHYSNGVYRPTQLVNSFIYGWQYIRIVGWQKDSWICANTWGTNWGQGGYFLISMGAAEIDNDSCNAFWIDLPSAGLMK